MSDRLDRIEAIVESNARDIEASRGDLAETKAIAESNARTIEASANQQAEIIAAISAQQATNTRDIDALVEGISGLATEIREVVQRVDESGQRIDGNAQRFDILLDEVRADRQRADERHAATQEILQSLLVELTKTNQRVDRLEQAG
ncbi:MAG: hypothetical protein AAFP07_20400 [Cyanobacteria bacterium J06606_4]